MLVNRVKTSDFATFSYGYFQSSVVLLFALVHEGRGKGIPRDQTRLITFFFAGGMLLATNVAGKLGDRYGHLLVMRLLAVVGTTMIAGFVLLNGFPAMAAAVAVAGASLASISPVEPGTAGAGHARIPPRDRVSTTRSTRRKRLLGPPISSQIYHCVRRWADALPPWRRCGRRSSSSPKSSGEMIREWRAEAAAAAIAATARSTSAAVTRSQRTVASAPTSGFLDDGFAARLQSNANAHHHQRRDRHRNAGNLVARRRAAWSTAPTAR